jgi:hypothetical protein
MPSEAEIDAGISIAETQLQLQAALFGSLDARAAGLLGFDGVLIGVDIATQTQLGSHWWFPLPGFALVAVLCVVAFATRFSQGPVLPDLYDPPDAWVSFKRSAYRTLGEAVARNEERIRDKRRVLNWVAVLLVAGVVVAWLLSRVIR